MDAVKNSTRRSRMQLGSANKLNVHQIQLQITLIAGTLARLCLVLNPVTFNCLATVLKKTFCC